MERYALREDQWQKVWSLLPGKAGDVGVTAADNRLFLNAVVWLMRSGTPWRDLPQRFGKWNSVFQRFNRWSKKGVWERVFHALQEPDLDWMMLDSTVIRAHQPCGWSKKRLT